MPQGSKYNNWRAGINFVSAKLTDKIGNQQRQRQPTTTATTITTATTTTTK